MVRNVMTMDEKSIGIFAGMRKQKTGIPLRKCPGDALLWLQVIN